MWSTVTVIVLSFLQTDILHAQRLDECVDDVVEVVENSPQLTLTCITTDTVTWRFKTPGGTSDITIGSCNSGASSCSVTGLPGFSLTRLNNSATRLHSTLTTRQDGGRYTYRCDLSTVASHACQANVVVRAVLSAVNVTLTPAGSSWTVQGSVDVTTVYSSIGRYSCQWFHKYGTGQESSVWKGSPSLSPDPSNTSNTQNRAGSCSFSMVTPGSTGTYTYRVLLSPGDSQAEKTIEIAPPDTVSAICSPSPYVPENTDVTCTCNTQSVGKPAGRLMWFRGSDNNNPINTGNYGNTSLAMTPQTMKRAQGDVQFRCDVDWAKRVAGQPYTAMVSYGPDQVIIPQNRTFYTDSAGSRDITLTCNASDVRPTIGLIYTWTGRCADVTISTCTFRPRPPGSSGDNDVNAQVGCTVRNPHNNNFTKQGSFQLDLKYPPSSPPTIGNYSQGQVLYEGENLTLTCTVTGGDPLVTSVNLTCPGHHDNGATSGQSSSLTIPSLSAADHGIECGCSGQWVRPDYYTLTDTRTLTVYYPPSEPNITRTDNLSFPYMEGDTVRLSCDLQSSLGNPTANLSWSGHGNGQTTTPDGAPATLVMTSVGKADNNRNITCRASNAWTQQKVRDVSSLFTLRVYYPPSSPPTIGNYSQGQVLYEGDNLTLTCTVTGGDPLVTSVNLTCPDHHDNGATSGQSSSLTIPSLSAADHGIECGCSGQWVRPDYYTLTDTRTLTVNYPPSEPNITRTDNLSFPYVEGDTVSLSCDLQPSRGNPTASLSWSGHDNGQITTPDGAPATLVMTSVGKEANNRNITCRASNAWTQQKVRDVSSLFTLRVYYSPLVNLTPLDNNTCQTTDNSAVCAVIQGQGVHFTCNADSNPPPATIVWRQYNSQDSGLDIGTGPDLHIASADRRKHNGNFTCNVTTGNLQGTGRHPLSSSRSLTVLVKYSPEQTELTVNNNAGNLTVSEGTTVVLACRADGRPTPNMRLVKKETGREVHSVAGGDLVVDDRDSWLNYTLTTVSCSDTGTYTCTAGNDVGPTDSGALFVSCTPRYAGPPPVDTPSVNYMNQSVQLTFNLWAFPAPVSHHIVFLGATLNTTQPAANVTGIVFNVTVRRTVELYNYTYDVTVVEVMAVSATGYYQLMVNNMQGEAQMVFQVHYNKPDPPGPPGPFQVAAVVGIAIAGIVAACVAAAIFVYYRKRRAAQKPGLIPLKKGKGHQKRASEEPDIITNSVYGIASDYEGEEGTMMMNTVYESSGNTDSKGHRGVYEEVDLNVKGKMASLQSTKTLSPLEDGDALYSKVKRNKSPAHKGETTDLVNPGDVYAHVNKPRTSPPLTSNDAITSSNENDVPHEKSAAVPAPEAKSQPAASLMFNMKRKHQKKEKPAKKKDAIVKGKQNPEGAYGNMLLTMNPVEGSVYENYGFSGDDSHAAPNGVEEGTAPTVNKDELIYTTIQFTDCQLKKAQQMPPAREATEYVSVDFTKQGPKIQD